MAAQCWTVLSLSGKWVAVPTHRSGLESWLGPWLQRLEQVLCLLGALVFSTVKPDASGSDGSVTRMGGRREGTWRRRGSLSALVMVVVASAGVEALCKESHLTFIPLPLFLGVWGGVGASFHQGVFCNVRAATACYSAGNQLWCAPGVKPGEELPAQVTQTGRRTPEQLQGGNAEWFQGTPSVHDPHPHSTPELWKQAWGTLLRCKRSRAAPCRYGRCLELPSHWT